MPPFEAIEIFVACAGGESFRSVARQLALSPSAVSRRIAALEAFLGTLLFDRLGQTQRLTPAGERYLDTVWPAIRAVQRAGAAVAERGDGRLTIAASHSLTTSWLMPRLSDAQAALGVEIELLPTRNPEVLRSGLAQIAIWGDMPPASDFTADPLFEGLAIAVAAPGDGRARMLSDAELRGQTLLGVRSPSGLWSRWFGDGQDAVSHVRSREFPTVQMMYEAAAAGDGVALAMPLVAEPYLGRGQLVPIASACRAIDSGYSLFRRRNRTGPTMIERRFTGWLKGQVRASMGTFGNITAVDPTRA